jgi:PAS domain S-box-containing protein
MTKEFDMAVRISRDSGSLTSVIAAVGGKLDAALEDIDVPVFVLDRGGRIRYLNHRAREYFGDIRNRPFTDVVAPKSQAAARVAFTRKMLGTERVSVAERELRTVDGDVLAEIHTVAMEADERVVGVFGIASPKRAPRLSRLPPRGLTPRQLEVLDQLAVGRSTLQIADALGISRDTVRNHVRGILRSLGVHSRLEAVVDARRRGLLSD